MRKAIIEIKPNKLARKLMGTLYEKIDHIEGKEILQMDFEKGVKLVIVDIVMKEGHRLEDVKMPHNAEVLLILKKSGNRYTAMVKGKVPKGKIMSIFKMFDIDVIYTLPYYGTSDLMRISCIGETESINKAKKFMGMLGETNIISVTPATFSDFNLLSVLTEKQKDIMIKAKKLGYYEYPRKVNANDLSEELGISKATTIEHLRKAEMRLISNLLEGY